MRAPATLPLDRQVSFSGWEVEVQEVQPGLTRCSRSGSVLHVRVGDWLPAQARTTGQGQLRSLLTADLAADGSVLLVTRCAPPALVVTERGPRLLPADGAVREMTTLDPGDLLVMCSAATLDTHPAGVVELLTAGPERARDTDPRLLVRNLLRGSAAGATAVVRRSPVFAVM